MNIKSLKLLMLSACLLLVAGSCAVTDVDHSVNFNRYRTFAWGPSDINVKNPVYNSSLINKNIHSTVEKELSARGIIEDKNNPDVLISYHTYTEQRQQSSGGYGGYAPYYSPFGFYRFGWGFPYMMPYYGWGGSPRMYTYTEGTLIIDITDFKTNEVVWRGTVKGNVDSISSLEKQIHKGVKAILKRYPGTPGTEQQQLLHEHKPIS